MTNSGDKFDSVIIPNCHRTASTEEKLQSCPFASSSKVLLDHNNSSTDIGIESSDEYHTPPEHNSSSQNSTHEVRPPTNTLPVDQDIEIQSTHQVFVEMPQREQGPSSNTEKRKLPFSMKTRKQNSNFSKRETFTGALNRVLKMVESRSGEDDGGDFMETAKMRGLTLPRPRWWPAEGFED